MFAFKIKVSIILKTIWWNYQLTKQNWPACQIETVLLFSRFRFQNLPSDTKSYRAFRETGPQARTVWRGTQATKRQFSSLLLLNILLLRLLLSCFKQKSRKSESVCTKTSLVFKFLKFKKKVSRVQRSGSENKTAQSTGCEKVTKYWFFN